MESPQALFALHKTATGLRVFAGISHIGEGRSKVYGFAFTISGVARSQPSKIAFSSAQVTAGAPS